MIYKRERNVRGVAKFMCVTAKAQLHPFEQQLCVRVVFFYFGDPFLTHVTHMLMSYHSTTFFDFILK